MKTKQAQPERPIAWIQRTPWIKRAAFGLSAALFAMALSVTTSEAATKFGVRGGYADLEGTVFDGAEALGDLKLYGLQAIFPLLGERLAIEIAGEGVSEELTFSIDGVEDAYDAEWNDIAIYTTARVQLLPPGLFGMYAGVGVGMHFSDIEAQGLDDVATEIRKDIETLLDEERNDFEWNAVAGLNMGLGRLVEVFGEGRYRDVTGDYGREGYAVYAGLNLRLP